MIRLLLALLAFLTLPFAAHAQMMPKQDDRVVFDIAAEDWVTTKTARVDVAVEAAVSGATAGSMRADMVKAVNALAKGDWRLTSFNRNQDDTGMEHWSAVYEARLPETDLSGLGEGAKKQSKAGMQLSVANIDFSPTLEEMEAAKAQLRTQIYKMANEQLAALNGTLPGRNYRIAAISFTGDDGYAPMPQVVKGRAAMAMMSAVASESAPAAAPMERSQKVTLAARITLAAAPDARHEPPAPMPAPEPKH